MTRLTGKARDAVETLLNTYSALCQAESRVGKRNQDFALSVSDEKNDSDFLSVGIANSIAKDALVRQKVVAAKALAKHGIQVS